jgi:amino acid transporter
VPSYDSEPDQRTCHEEKGLEMGAAQKTRSRSPVGGDTSKAGLWGFFSGVITAALIAVPLSAAFAFATHPETRFLFSNAVEVSATGYTTFWWVATLFLLSLPFRVGFGVARMSRKTLGILAGIVVVFLIVLFVLAQVLFW